MKLISFYETSYDGFFKLIFENDITIFVRQEYLPTINLCKIQINDEFSQIQDEELIDGGFCSNVEIKAIKYLARSEQCKFKLTQKLIQKGFEKKYIENALSFLESKNYLNDFRFARAWLNTRKINHYEGKIKLLNELQSRGISKEISEKAVNEFFEENSESEICLKAYEKFKKIGKTCDKLINSLLNAGFSYKLIKCVIENTN